MKVLIDIRGGVVVNVQADHPDADILIRDFDNVPMEWGRFEDFDDDSAEQVRAAFAERDV